VGADGAPRAARGRRSWQTGGRLVARIGAPPLIALTAALGLLALLLCALCVPGFVLRAEADTFTPPAQTEPAQPAAPGAVDPATTEPAPADAGGATPAESQPAQPEPVEPPPGQALVTLPWGDGAGQVGLARAEEGLTRGPEALAIAPDGRIAILDSVNSRVVLLAADGSHTGDVPVALSEPRFLAVDDNVLYVLDADADHELVCVDWQGALVHRRQMPAPADVVTGLFATNGGPCVEVAHDDVFLVDLEDSGNKTSAGKRNPGRVTPATLRALAGRPLERDLAKQIRLSFKRGQGIKLKRFDVDRKTLKSVLVQEAAPAFPAGTKLEHLVSVDSDGKRGLVVGARLLRDKGDPQNEPSLVVGRMPADTHDPTAIAAMAGTITLSDSPFAYLGQPYAVSPDGRVFQPVGGEEGYSIMVYSLPDPAVTDTPAGTPEVSGEGVQP
jgi:hypothetical protein